MNKKSGPKPFSYGVDLDELKQKRQKIAPPVAPKKYKGKGMDSSPVPGSDSMTHAQFDSLSPAKLQPVAPPAAPSNRGDNSGEFSRPPLKAVTPRAGTNINSSGGAAQVHEYQPPREAAHLRAQEELPPQFRGGVNSNPKKQSLSFKVLQWMTETDPGEEGAAQQPVAEAAEEESPRKAKTKGGRHNAEDDEMRFSGLNQKTDIPSKSFQLLQKYNLLDENSPAPDSKPSDQGEGQQEEEGEEVGHYNEASIRYKGKHIPSPSFRVLKSWAELDTPVDTPSGKRRPSKQQQEEEDDGMPETLSGEEMVDKRYKGGNIPSRVFKTLQKAVGDDTPEDPNSSGEQQKTANGDAGKARSIKVLTKPTVAPSDTAVTDF